MNIFLSSTCYDLAEGVRSTIEMFLKQLGHKILLSERSTFPHYSQMHRQEICIKEVELCEYFILIIGGRAGAPYYKDDNISITHAEFNAAKALKKSIICFVKSDVFAERVILNKNSHENFKCVFAQDMKVHNLLHEIQSDLVTGLWVQPYSNVQDILNKLKSNSDIYKSDRLVFYTLGIISELYEDFFHEYSRELDMEVRSIPVRTSEIEEAIKKTNNELLLLELPIVEAVNILEHSPFSDELCVVGMTYSTPPISQLSDFEKFSLYWIGDPQKSFDDPGSIKLFLNVGESSIATVLAKLFAMKRDWKVDLYSDSVSVQLSKYEDILRHVQSLPGPDKNQVGIAFVLSGKAERDFRRLEPNISPIVAEHHLMKLFIDESSDFNLDPDFSDKLKNGIPGTLILARRSQVLVNNKNKFSDFFACWEEYVSNLNIRKNLENSLFHPIPRMLPWAIENIILFVDAMVKIEESDRQKHKHLLNDRLNVWKFMPLIKFSNKEPYFSKDVLESYKKLYLKEINRWKNDFVPPRKTDHKIRSEQKAIETLENIEEAFELILEEILEIFGEVINIDNQTNGQDQELNNNKIDGFFDILSIDMSEYANKDITYFSQLYTLLDKMYLLQGKCILFNERYYRF